MLKKFLLQKFPGILSLHEVHCWTFTPGKLVVTGHIMYQNEQVYSEIHCQVETFFNSQGFSQLTIQPEFPPSSNPSKEDISSCTLKCKVELTVSLHSLHFLFPQSEECGERTCCKDEVTACCKDGVTTCKDEVTKLLNCQINFHLIFQGTKCLH